jgi:hypothetical protein
VALLAAGLILVAGTLGSLFALAGFDRALAAGLTLGWTGFMGLAGASLWRTRLMRRSRAGFLQLAGGLPLLATLLAATRLPGADDMGFGVLWILAGGLLLAGVLRYFGRAGV